MQKKASPLKSKSTVVLHIDIVGSTEFVRQDMMLAHERIQNLYRRIRHITKIYSGRVYELRGDAAVIGFRQADNAVKAALTLQQTNALLNSTRLGLIEPRMRIGISMGEIVIGDNTITGEPVIVAQRLEQQAKPSEVIMDDKVRLHLNPHSNHKIDLRDEKFLKGFSEPTIFYSVNRRADNLKFTQNAFTFSGNYRN